MSLPSVIHEHGAEIVAEWTDEARYAASARGLDRPALTSVLHVFLESLADAGEELGRFSGRRREVLESHLASRLRQGFVLPEILDEIGLVGRALVRVWEHLPPEERPSAREVAGVFRELNEATIVVAEAFTHHMLEDEQTEKRYRRLLERIGADALKPGHATFRERLSEVVELVMEAMAAQTASLLLFDSATDCLVRSATVGAAHEEVERLVSSRNPGTFEGRVASREESTSIVDVATTELEVGESLRNSGIHALLGVRLPPLHSLVGVLYVGISEARPFTPREVRRLEALGDQLVLQLDNAKLYADLVESIERLEAARAINERLVALIAHDLRGPLASVKLRAEALMRRPESLDERCDLVARINANVDRMDRMIRDLLDAYRIRSGESLPLRLERCDLGALARNVCEELRLAHGDRFVLRAAPGLVGYWSTDELRRAIWNLADNAVKYGAKDEPIVIALRSAGETVAIDVHNSGAPISSEDQKHIFDPFARAGVPGRPRGWGLGLTLVRGCAEAHGGRVTVESTRENGTTFTIELPRSTGAGHRARVARGG